MLAAYLKPRETGETQAEPGGEIAEIVDGARPRRGILRLRRAARASRRRRRCRPSSSISGRRRCAGCNGEDAAPVAAPEAGDKRFADPEWRSNPYFDFLKQAYVLTTRWANDLVERADGLDPHTRDKAQFYLRQVTSALSPSNFLATNPELLRTTLAESGENLVRGLQHDGRGHRRRARQSAHPPVRRDEVHARRQSRRDARQGDLSQRTDRAHPIRADDAERLQAAAADRAAVDQQVLRARPQSGKILHPLGGGARA